MFRNVLYTLVLTIKKKKNDLFEIKDLQAVINPAHGILSSTNGNTLGRGLNARGFTVTNPNVSKTYGCELHLRYEPLRKIQG